MYVTAAVGEQDAALRPWTEAEETYLANAAGILSPENLGRALGRTGGLGAGGGRAARAATCVRRVFLRLARPLRYVRKSA